MRPTRPLIALAVAAGFGSLDCAAPQRIAPTAERSRADRKDLVLSDWRPPPGQTCEIMMPDRGLPAADAIVDTAAVESAIARLSKSSDPPVGYALFSIMADRDSTGRPRRVHLLESDLPVETAAAVVELVQTHLRLPPEGQRNVRLRLTLGDGVRFAVGAQEMCKPVLRNRTDVEIILSRAARRLGYTGTAVVWIFVDRLGNVRRARLKESAGVPGIDELAVQLAYRMKLYPALSDRVPVPVWVTIPVVVRKRPH